MAINSTAQLSMSLDSWRGYSAYEIAVQNGFEGTEQEWLESLRGADGVDGTEVTVNNKTPVDGNITIRGTDIYVQAGSAVTVAEKLSKTLAEDAIEDSLVSEDATKALSAKQGKVLDEKVNEKAKASAMLITLAVDGWATEAPYTQTVNVAGMTADAESVSSMSTPSEASRATWIACQVRPVEQGDGTLTFKAEKPPEEEVVVQLLVVEGGVLA